MKPKLFTNGRFCTPQGIRPNLSLEVRGGRIAGLFPVGRGNRKPVETIDLQGRYLLPGFLEIHTHGAGGFELTAGRYRPERGAFESSGRIYRQELPLYCRRRASTGITGLYLGTLAAPVKRLQFVFRQLADYMESAGNGRDGCLVHGGLLEGTFMLPEFCGAHNTDYIYPPDIELFKRINESEIIRLTNVVPDSGTPALKLIRHLARRGISVGAGHTNASHRQFQLARRAGLKYIIHLLNGPTGHSYKVFEGGGALEAALAEPFHVEIIADGIHVNPLYVRDILARKGPGKVMLVTDSMFPSQAGLINHFNVSGIAGGINHKGRYAYVIGKKPITLFSTLITMDQAFGNLLSWLTVEGPGIWHEKHPARPFNEALAIVSRCCSANIAAMLKEGGGDDLETGELAAGRWADLVAAEITGRPGRYRLRVREVYVRGRRVWPEPEA
ncbi:MAG TPA: hypothetical protein PKN80_05160 [bacterium]|nr:hypothetical protein [bacterium]HNS49036.1 hypothetical protein [bacterium]